MATEKKARRVSPAKTPLPMLDGPESKLEQDTTAFLERARFKTAFYEGAEVHLGIVLGKIAKNLEAGELVYINATRAPDRRDRFHLSTLTLKPHGSSMKTWWSRMDRRIGHELATEGRSNRRDIPRGTTPRELGEQMLEKFSREMGFSQTLVLSIARTPAGYFYEASITVYQEEGECKAGEGFGNIGKAPISAFKAYPALMLIKRGFPYVRCSVHFGLDCGAPVRELIPKDLKPVKFGCDCDVLDCPCDGDCCDHIICVLKHCCHHCILCRRCWCCCGPILVQQEELDSSQKKGWVWLIRFSNATVQVSSGIARVTFQGPAGPAGPAGAPGPAPGTPGTAGPGGPDGTSGAGHAGDAGSDGVAGTASSGAAGTGGVVGTSAMGTSGVDGLSPQGAGGVAGTTGTTTQGTSGQQGSAGTGQPGGTGVQGIAGDGGTGDGGPSGDGGVAGASGQGGQGAIGTSDPGAAGDGGVTGTSDPGVAGDAGVSGAGDPGAAGAAGDSGTSTPGDSGQAGIAGTSSQGAGGAGGDAGTIGQTGSSGNAGSSGVSGSPGVGGGAGVAGATGPAGVIDVVEAGVFSGTTLTVPPPDVGKLAVKFTQQGVFSASLDTSMIRAIVTMRDTWTSTPDSLADGNVAFGEILSVTIDGSNDGFTLKVWHDSTKTKAITGKAIEVNYLALEKP